MRRRLPTTGSLLLAVTLAGPLVTAQVRLRPERILTRCPGCRFGPATPAPGFRAGWRGTVFAPFRTGLRFTTFAVLGWSGFCNQGRGCRPFRNCRMAVLAVILNRTGGDLWFQVDRHWIGLRSKGGSRPDRDGWVRIPNGRSAAYFAGVWDVGCTGVPRTKSVDILTKKHGGRLAARMEWSAKCSPCAVRADSGRARD